MTLYRPTNRFSNREVAALLAGVAARLQILEANRFRVIAFQNAAESIRNLAQDLYTLDAAGELTSIQGIGKGIGDAIHHLLVEGNVPEFEQLFAQVPEGVVDMMRVPDMGPKKARRLWEELGIDSLEALRVAAGAGRLRLLKGFGARSEEKILEGIELLAKRAGGAERLASGVARPLAMQLVAELLGRLPEGTVERIEVAGSLRRWKETVGDVDILCVSTQPQRVMETFQALREVASVVRAGETRSSVLLGNELQVDLRVVERQHWGAALQYFTGSKEHNVALRELALKQGWRLNEYGLTGVGTGAVPAGTQRFFEEEQALYAFLGVEWIPPELREQQGEGLLTRQQQLPVLVTLADLKGELHGHTTWSDGTGSVAAMADAARALGYSYWNVSDHSVGLGIVQGVDGERLRRQRLEIDAYNRRCVQEGSDFRLLQGCEVEILADGTLGLADELLAELEVVVASIHSAQRQDRTTITERCLKAIRNPQVDILGHPTGRLLGERPETAIDMEQVLQACQETGTVVEINAHPSRLDVNDVYARRAVELGCRLAVNCDAHAVDGMRVAEYGIGVARRAGLTAADVVNTRPLAGMLALLKDGQLQKG